MLQIKFDKAWLRYLIDMRGVSLTELARRMGVTLQTVSNFMVGRRQPSTKMLARIFTALGMTADEAQAAIAELYKVEVAE
jgi:transcriptional regulator with XRE-family HTH domain